MVQSLAAIDQLGQDGEAFPDQANFGTVGTNRRFNLEVDRQARGCRCQSESIRLLLRAL